VTLEETDESVFWTELIIESGMNTQKQTVEFLREGNELVAIFVASSNTIRSRLSKSHKPNTKIPKSNLKSEI